MCEYVCECVSLCVCVCECVCMIVSCFVKKQTSMPGMAIQAFLITVLGSVYVHVVESIFPLSFLSLARTSLCSQQKKNKTTKSTKLGLTPELPRHVSLLSPHSAHRREVREVRRVQSERYNLSYQDRINEMKAAGKKNGV